MLSQLYFPGRLALPWNSISFFFSGEDTVFFTKIKRNDYLNIILGRIHSSEIKIKHIVEPIYLQILTHVVFLNQ